MIAAWISAFLVLTAGTYALLRRELSTAPLSFPGPAGARVTTASKSSGAVMPAAVTDEPLYPLEMARAAVGRAGEGTTGPLHNAKVHEWARVARRVAAGERAQVAIAAARAGHETAREAIRQAGLVAAIRARCAEPIAHLEDISWREDTGSFRKFVEA